MSTKTGLSATKCGARCLIDRIRLGEMAFANSPSLLLRASGTSIAPRDSQSSLRSELQIADLRLAILNLAFSIPQGLPTALRLAPFRRPGVFGRYGPDPK